VPLDFGEKLEGGKQESNQNRRVNTYVKKQGWNGVVGRVTHLAQPLRPTSLPNYLGRQEPASSSARQPLPPLHRSYPGLPPLWPEQRRCGQSQQSRFGWKWFAEKHGINPNESIPPPRFKDLSYPGFSLGTCNLGQFSFR
jgi:hypothetical protein